MEFIKMNLTAILGAIVSVTLGILALMPKRKQKEEVDVLTWTTLLSEAKTMRDEIRESNIRNEKKMSEKIQELEKLLMKKDEELKRRGNLLRENNIIF